MEVYGCLGLGPQPLQAERCVHWVLPGLRPPCPPFPLPSTLAVLRRVSISTYSWENRLSANSQLAQPWPRHGQVPRCQHPIPTAAPTKSCGTSTQAGAPREGHGDTQQCPCFPATSMTPLNSHPEPSSGTQQRHREATKHRSGGWGAPAPPAFFL